MSFQKKDVLIIEDSVATTILLSEFLKKLGYQNIHTCNTGQAAVQVFDDLVKANKMPIILLDYSLPDMNADAVMTQIFSIRPDTKIVIQTASEKGDESIKDVLRHGAYLYLEKPIRFENLKNTMKVLEEEDKILEDKPVDAQKQIDSHLKSSSRISLARISEYCNVTKEDTMQYLRELESEKKIVSLGNIKEISCNLCGSVKIGLSFHCPSCNSSNFKHGKLIEHFKCGNVSLDNTYVDNICPKCHKEIQTIGVDYRAMENYYMCTDCGEKFAEPLNDYLCMKCNNRFKIDQATWITSEAFRAVNL